MAYPFYTTLATTTAAIAGFAVAVSTIHYSLEYQRREDNTRDLRIKVNEFKDEIQETGRYVYWFSDRYEVNRGIRDDFEPEEQIPHAYNLAKSLGTINSVASNAEDNPLGVLWDSELEEIRQAIDDSQRQSGRNELIQIFKTQHDIDFDSLDNREIRNKLKESFVVFGDMPLTLEEISDEISRLDRIFGNIERETDGTLVNYEPKLSTVIWLSGYLLLVGVFIPLVHISFSNSSGVVGHLLSELYEVSQAPSIVLEVFLLVSCLFLTSSILEVALKALQPPHMNEDLSSLTVLLIRNLPKVNHPEVE